MNPLRSSVPFYYRPPLLPRPLLDSWPEQLISCPLAHVQPFHQILWKSVNHIGRCAITFCDRLLPLPHPFGMNTHTHTHTTHKHTCTHTHTHLTSMPNFSLLGQKLWPPKSGECLWTTNWQSCWLQLKSVFTNTFKINAPWSVQTLKHT